jgi:adenylate cyclase
MSADPGDDYLCDGVTEDIITELARFSELFVIARNSSFHYKGRAVDVRQIGSELGVRYILEGSIRRRGGDLRLTGQLVDAATGAHRWADRHDRKLEDVFALQDELARTIAAILAAHVNKAEEEHALCKPPASWQAHDYFLRATAVMASYWSSMDVEQVYEARRLLDLCLRSDPNYARAAALLSCTHLTAYLNPLDQDFFNAAARDRAFELARNGVRLGPNLPFVRAHLGIVLACRQEHDAAIAEFEKAIALDANFCHLHFALALILAGEPARALEVISAHMRLDPFYTPQALLYMGMAFYMLKQYTQAIDPLREALLRAPNFLGSQTSLAAAYAQLGLLDKAHAHTAEIRRTRPQARAERGRRFLGLYKNAEDADHFYDGYQKAGLT